MFSFLSIFRGWLDQHTYEYEMEKYITRHNPQSVADVDQLAKEFEQKSRRGYFDYHLN